MDALITSRDGIVGRWREVGAGPKPLPIGDGATIARWQQSVRLRLVEAELLSRVVVTAAPRPEDASAGACSVWHVGDAADAGEADVPQAGACEPLLRFVKPAPDAFIAQMPFLESYAALRSDRAVEIHQQLDSPVPFLGTLVLLRPDQHRWTMELLEAVFRLTQSISFQVKHLLACPRPVEFSPQVQPIVLTPGHATLPSAHAAEAFALAYVLWRLVSEANRDVPGLREQLLRMAGRIAVNRTVAGVHFPMDSIAGAVLGLTAGAYVAARAGSGKGRSYRPARFDLEGCRDIASLDFSLSKLIDSDRDDQPQDMRLRLAGDCGAVRFGPGFRDEVDLGDSAVPGVLGELWGRALTEWNPALAEAGRAG